MDHEDQKVTKNTKVREPFKGRLGPIEDVAHAVIGAAIEVHRVLGPGFLEATYEHAMVLELGLRHIAFERQLVLPTEYKGCIVAESRLDLLVEGNVVVELKSVEELRPVHTAQVLSYLRAGCFQLGLLFNFNTYSLRNGIKRVIWSG